MLTRRELYNIYITSFSVINSIISATIYDSIVFGGVYALMTVLCAYVVLSFRRCVALLLYNIRIYPTHSLLTS